MQVLRANYARAQAKRFTSRGQRGPLTSGSPTPIPLRCVASSIRNMCADPVRPGCPPPPTAAFLPCRRFLCLQCSHLRLHRGIGRDPVLLCVLHEPLVDRGVSRLVGLGHELDPLRELVLGALEVPALDNYGRHHRLHRHVDALDGQVLADSLEVRVCRCCVQWLCLAPERRDVLFRHGMKRLNAHLDVLGRDGGAGYPPPSVLPSGTARRTGRCCRSTPPCSTGVPWPRTRWRARAL
mmetsp:Transcript_32439/g.81736  ORF Transcript_32439/g.81736 Transcript_32439/m.81736 type:complete len:238 (-) Transcript_32439:908-1621(-)